MFRLDKGATGFRGAKDDPLPETDLQAFRAAWYTGARLAGGKPGELVRRTYSGSFHTATVHHRDGTQVVLCHAHLPLVAFAADQRQGCLDEFLDPPAWSDAFADLGFTVLAPALLNSPLSAADTSGLSRAEWVQIRAWRATGVGEVLFNSWD